jgi:glycerophosphoryl diester phosphodiesterase
LLKQGPRRNLFLLHEPDLEEFKRVDRAATTLDVAPTLLGALGIETGQMGFGVNLLGDEPTLPEMLGVDSDNRSAIDKYLLGFRSVFNRLWDFPDLSRGLYANIEKGEIQLGESAFRAPVLFAFDNELAVSQAILGEKNAEATLTEAVLNFEPGQKYIWVDDCRALRYLELSPKKHDKSGLCAAFGRRSEGSGLFNFERSGFLPTPTLEAWIAVGGDPDMAVLETDRIEAIGRRRGELPIAFPYSSLTQNQGRGVMLHSAAFGAGRSMIRRQTTDHLDAGEDVFLRRGINLIGIGADGRTHVIDRLDNCGTPKNDYVSNSWLKIIKAGQHKFLAHALVVHDTAFCGSALDGSDPVLMDLPLPELKASQMRQPYIGLIDRQGRVFEYAEREFSKLRVFLDPSGKGLVPHDSLVDVKLDAKSASQKVALSVNSNAVTDDAVRIAFASEAAQKLASKSAVGETIDKRVRCRLPEIPNQALSAASRPLVVNSRASIEFAEKKSQISFGKGWWGTEAAGRWIGNDAAQLSLFLPTKPRGLNLKLEIVAYPSARKDIVLQYGKADIRTLENSDDTRLNFDVSRLPRGEPVTINIYSGKQEAGCPALHKKSRDNRALRYMLKSIELVPAKYNPIGLSVGHGGGRLSGTAITNSFDALQNNRDRFEAFEIDFEWTEDGDLVCLHDWSQSFASRFGDGPKPPLSLSEFRLRLAQTPESARNCDLEGLAGWMRANPNKLIVTDVKSKLLPAHELIATRHPDLLSQFVPQAQQPDEISILRSMGFTNVVWTLYRFGSDADKVVEYANLERPDAITMPESFASKGLLELVATATELPVLVHTVNDEASASCLMQKGAAGIYSDDLGSLKVLGLNAKGSTCELIPTQ